MCSPTPTPMDWASNRSRSTRSASRLASCGARPPAGGVQSTWTCGKAILSQPDTRFAALPRLPIDAEGPVFDEPWQAQAFALAVQLHAAGAFSWTDWAAALADELNRADLRGEP